MSRPRLFFTGFLGCLSIHGVLAWLLVTPGTRFVKYPLAAAQYLAGTLPNERLADLSPGYFYLHVLSQWLGGGEAAQPVLLLQLFLIALTAALLALLMSESGLPAGWALAGATLFACSRGVIVYAGMFEPEALLLFLLVAMVWLLGKDDRTRLLAAGGAMGLALLTRPSVMPLLILVPLWLRLRHGRCDWRQESALFLALPLLGLALLAGRNLIAYGSLSPTVMNPGFVFFEGNNPLSTGQSAAYPPLVGELKNELSTTPDNPHVTYRELARRDSGRPLAIAETNRYWWMRALAFMRAYPGEALTRLGIKLHGIVHGFRWHDLGPAQLADERLTALRLPLPTLAPLSGLALLGLVAVRRRWREFLLPAMVVGLQMLLLLLFYVSERQRLPMVPFLVLFACLGMRWAISQTNRWKVQAASVLMLWTVIFSWPTDRMRDTLHLWAHYRESDRLWTEALELRGRGRLAEAAETAAASLAAAPWLRDDSRPAFLPLDEAQFFSRARVIQAASADPSPSGRFDAGLLALYTGQLDIAGEVLTQLVAEGRNFNRAYLQSSRPEYYLAEVSLRRGDREEARRWAKAALVANPGEPFALALLSALTGETAYREALRSFFGELDAAWLTGRALFLTGQPAAAASELQKVTRQLPELRRAKTYLAASYGRSGRPELGRAVYAEVLAGPDPVFLEQDILGLYTGGAPQDPLSRFRHGQVLAAFGRLEEGLVLMREAGQESGDPGLMNLYHQVAGLTESGSLRR